jgi:hypothetical protein
MKKRASRGRSARQAPDPHLDFRLSTNAADDAYEAGYRAKPQRLTEINAYARTAAEVLTPEDWD